MLSVSDLVSLGNVRDLFWNGNASPFLFGFSVVVVSVLAFLLLLFFERSSLKDVEFLRVENLFLTPPSTSRSGLLQVDLHEDSPSLGLNLKCLSQCIQSLHATKAMNKIQALKAERNMMSDSLLSKNAAKTRWRL